MSLAIGQQINSINVAENNYIPGHENKHDSNTALLQAGSQSECQGSSVHVVSSKLQSAPTPLITPKSETDSNGQSSCSTTNRDTAAQYPSLHFLAAQGEAAKIKEELDKGADINAVDKTGLTPLAWAAAHRQKATVSLLLQNGADATISSPNGESALAFGTCQGQLDIVEQLLDSGADPNVTTADGGSPLMFASYSGYPQMVKVLLEHGADLTATNNEGNTALSLAVGMGNKNVQRVIDDYLRSVLEKPINHE